METREVAIFGILVTAGVALYNSYNNSASDQPVIEEKDDKKPPKGIMTQIKGYFSPVSSTINTPAEAINMDYHRLPALKEEKKPDAQSSISIKKAYAKTKEFFVSSLSSSQSSQNRLNDEAGLDYHRLPDENELKQNMPRSSSYIGSAYTKTKDYFFASSSSSPIERKSDEKHQDKKPIIREDKNRYEIKEESKEELKEVQMVKQRLLTQIEDIPPDLKCTLSLEILKDPLITPNGKCYSQVEILDAVRNYNRCPLDNIPLEAKVLAAHPPIRQLIAAYQQKYDDMLKSINGINVRSKDGVLIKFAQYKKDEGTAAAKMQILKLNYSLDYIKNRLRIDSKNEAHLQYWHNQNDRCFHTFGGEEMKHANGRIFRVPTRIKRMMEVAAQPHIGPHRLVAALDRAREHKPSFWNNPFSWMTRSETTSRIYNTQNLTTFDL